MNQPHAFTPDLDALKGAVDASLFAVLTARREALPEAGPLLDEIERMVTAGGKRLRPAFCYWGYRAARGPHGDEIVRAAGALELLHTFAIVHDDIMDRSEARRGVPSVHARHGVAVALLVGDLALVLADDTLVASGFPADVVRAAFAPYSRMRQEVIAGQYLDLVASGRGTVTEAMARRIAVLKSGRYSVEEPLAIGATLAGADDATRSALESFGQPLGEAFQLRDDLLGTFGESVATGKPVDSDIREGKRNVLYAKALTALAGDEREFFARRWGAPGLDPDDVDYLRSLIEKSGARAATEELLQDLTATARRALGSLDVDDEARAALEHLTEIATQRRR